MSNEEEEELGDHKAKCIIRNYETSAKVQLFASKDEPICDFMRRVADALNCDSGSFRLSLMKKKKVKDLTDTMTEPLSSVGLSFEEGNRNAFSLLSNEPECENYFDTASSGHEFGLGASASPTSASFVPPEADNAIDLVNQLKEKSSKRTYQCRSSAYNSDCQYPSTTGYVGLVNQAMTCYLNSLLQALFMTPEFRNALYNWEYEGQSKSCETKSIPYQLQKLFLRLQTSSKSAVETTELTKSFGWDSSEAWQQHDIQELCRVMFDALERKFEGTEQACLINKLYQGKMIDYVKCLECGNEKQREDTFLDIPLPIRPYGSTIAYGSIEEALRSFVKPETLDGNNQYFCEGCGKKCDAHKGLKFTHFPYLLTLHLMRFDFDYSTMHRIKLNDKVTFPQILHLDHFIEDNSGSSALKEEEKMVNGEKNDDNSTTDSGSALDDDTCLPSVDVPLRTASQEMDQDSDEGIDVGCASNSAIKDTSSRYVYELFSIMIHSGSASGGHYYAYIKDFSSNKWFCFNDQSVSPLMPEDIEKTYGGGSAHVYYSGAYSTSINAYMLMYRQIDKEKNALPMTVDEFPPHLKELHKNLEDKEKTTIREIIKKMEEKEKTDSIESSSDLEWILIRFHYYCPIRKEFFSSTDKSFLTTYNFKHLKQTGYRWLEKTAEIETPEKCRLVSYDISKEVAEGVLEGEDSDPLSTVLGKFGDIRSSYSLMIDFGSTDASTIQFLRDAIKLQIYRVDIVKAEIRNSRQITCSKCITVEAFKEIIKRDFELACDVGIFIAVGTKCRMDQKNIQNEQKFPVLEDYNPVTCELKFLTDDQRTLKEEEVPESANIFICFLLQKCPSNPLSLLERMFNVIDTQFTVTSARFNLPGVPNVEKLKIYRVDVVQETIDFLGNKNIATSQTVGMFKEKLVSDFQSPSAFDVIVALDVSSTPQSPLEFKTSELHFLNHDQLTLEDEGVNHSKKVYVCFETSPSPDNSLSTMQQMLKVIDVENNLIKVHFSLPDTRPELLKRLRIPSYSETKNDEEVGIGDSSKINISENNVTSTKVDNFVNTGGGGVTSGAGPGDLGGLCGDGPCSKFSSTAVLDNIEEEHVHYSDQSASEDSSLTDSDRTIIGDVPDEYQMSSASNSLDTSPQLNQDLILNTSSDEENRNEDSSNNLFAVKNSHKYDYFKCEVFILDTRMLEVYLDRRMPFETLVEKIQPYVGVRSEYFKIYSKLKGSVIEEKIDFLKDYYQASNFYIKLVIPLKLGESKIDIYLFRCGQQAQFVDLDQPLFEWIVKDGEKVGDTKKAILEELKNYHNIEIPFDRCRIRRKKMGMEHILLDEQLWKEDYPILNNKAFYLQELSGPEIKTRLDQTIVSIRQYFPETTTVGPLQEIILYPPATYTAVLKEISRVSGIPEEHLDVARYSWDMPYEMLLDDDVAHIKNVRWDVKNLGSMGNVARSSLNISVRDGLFVLYVDERQKYKATSNLHKVKLNTNDKKSSVIFRSKAMYASPRKERGLKIHLGTSPVNSVPAFIENSQNSSKAEFFSSETED